MKPIFKSVPDHESLPEPWQPTHMVSYAKGRPRKRVWTRLATNREADRQRRAEERQARKPMDDLIRKIAREAKVTQQEVREYIVAHQHEIFGSA